MKIQVKLFLKKHSVVLLFFFLSLGGFLLSGLSFSMVISDLTERLGRNLILVLSLILPIVAGLGINFALVIGAMVGQLALLFILVLGWKGFGGVFGAMAIALPLGMLCGLGCGLLLNRVKGREMVVSLILGYFATGVYQFLCLRLPVKNPALVSDGGIGVKNTIDLSSIQYAFDKFPMEFRLFGIKIPLFTLLLSALFCFLLYRFKETKLGQHMRGAGLSPKAAEAAGISVDTMRLLAMMASTVLAAWGQIISLQNLGTLNTYGSHEQVSIYGAAALLVGGATLKKAEAHHALLGTLLFYLLFIVAPRAGANLTGDAQLGEFFRVFLSYGVIVLALVFHHKKDTSKPITK